MQMVRRARSNLDYHCTTKDKDVAVGSIPSSIETEKLAASILFLDLGIIDSITEKARTYPMENVIRAPRIKRNYEKGLKAFNRKNYKTK